MAKYANLKDYFHNVHIKLIQDAISDYLRNDVQISETFIHSLVCTYDDAEYNAEFEIGVSVRTVGVTETSALCFIVTVRGNIEQRFKDIEVIGVRSASNNLFPEDNILSQFILPDIPEDEIERIGNDLYNFYSNFGYFENYKLSIPQLVDKGKLFFAPLPKNCLGRIILSESDVKIIHNVETKNRKFLKENIIHADHGTILVNYEKYAKKFDGGLRITVAHELVHTLFHDRFLKLLQMLGEEKVDMDSSEEPITLDKNMTDIQKAICIAEWQANVLAMRLAIPKITVDGFIYDILFDPSTWYEHRGEQFQACINKFAKRYGVSPLIVKERLLQLGYNNFDGTCIMTCGKHIVPFSFNPNKLEINETFVIYRSNYEKLLNENKAFEKLLKNRVYVYTGYVVCLNDIKYINPVIYGRKFVYELTEYAREHADECCMIFKKHKANNNSINKVYYSDGFLEKLEDGEYSNGDELTPAAIQDLASYRKKYQEECEAKGILLEMEQKEIVSFKEALNYHMKRKKVNISKLSDEEYLKEETLKKYVNGNRSPKLVNVLIICNKLELQYVLAKDLLSRAGLSLNLHSNKERLYDYLLTITNASLKDWDLILKKQGYPPLK